MSFSMMHPSSISQPHEASLLIIDDDQPFCNSLARAMERRRFNVQTASSIEQGKTIAGTFHPAFAVVDLRLKDGNGLEVVPTLRQMHVDARIVMLTGYGNLATAVAAVKAGAVDYLAKPADADQVEAALRLNFEQSLPQPPENPMTADRIRWEHIQRVYQQCDRNVSETARRLRMHRRTLQRILSKHAPRD